MDTAYDVGGQIKMNKNKTQKMDVPALGYRDRNTGYVKYCNNLGNYWSGEYEGSTATEWYYYNIFIGPTTTGEIPNISQVNSTNQGCSVRAIQSN